MCQPWFGVPRAQLENTIANQRVQDFYISNSSRANWHSIITNVLCSQRGKFPCFFNLPIPRSHANCVFFSTLTLTDARINFRLIESDRRWMFLHPRMASQRQNSLGQALKNPQRRRFFESRLLAARNFVSPSVAIEQIVNHPARNVAVKMVTSDKTYKRQISAVQVLVKTRK